MVSTSTPKPGTILELHSLSASINYNGKLVAFADVKGAKWVVKLLENEKAVAVPPERTRRPIIFDDDNTTPAPSLEEMPPEQGTILQLQNIGDPKYDGMMVEFRSFEKGTGRYFVDFLDDGQPQEGLRVKAKCCSRPPVKSMELRDLLSDIVNMLRKTNKSGAASKEDVAVRAKTLLDIDACCVPALLLLKDVTYTEPENCFHTESQQHFRYLRRGVANILYYEEKIRQEDILENFFWYSVTLATMGRHKLSERYKQRCNPLRQNKSLFDQYEHMRARIGSLFMSCYDFKKELKYDKALKNFLYLAEGIIEVTCWVEDKRVEISVEPRGGEIFYSVVAMENFFGAVRENIFEIHEILLKEEKERQNIDDEKQLRRNPMMVEAWKKALDIANRALDAHTRDDGTIHFADPATKRELQKLRFKALLEIKHDNEMKEREEREQE